MGRPIEFTELKPKIWQTLHATYESLSASSSAPGQVLAALAADLTRFGFSEGDSARIAAAFMKSFDSIRGALALNEADPSVPDYESAASPSGKLRLALTEQDVSCMRAILADEPSYDARRLLVAFAAWDRANYHRTGWIRYDRQSIMCLAGLSGLRPRDQEALTQRLHRGCGLDMQVVGSNSPIPCFRLSWLEEEPPTCDPSNPLIDLGPLSPSAIAFATCETLGLPPTAKPGEGKAKGKGKAEEGKGRKKAKGGGGNDENENENENEKEGQSR